jgi:hypothetical protein
MGEVVSLREYDMRSFGRSAKQPRLTLGAYTLVPARGWQEGEPLRWAMPGGRIIESREAALLAVLNGWPPPRIYGAVIRYATEPPETKRPVGRPEKNSEFERARLRRMAEVL